MKKITLLFLLLPFLGLSQVQIGQGIYGLEEGDSSGRSVSISSNGNIVAIGALGDGLGNDIGYARVFENQSGNWVQLGNTIESVDFNDSFGSSLSLSSDGTILVINAHNSNENGYDTGKVQIFQYDGTNWNQLGQSIIGANSFEIGFDVDISDDGGIIAISSKEKDRVYIYSFNGSSWNLLGNVINGEFLDDWAGYSISLSSDGSKIAIGAIFNDGNGNNSGQVRVYEYNGMDWFQLGNDIDGEAPLDGFGVDVSLSSSGNILAVGASGNENGTGHVRVFQYNNSNWIQIGNDIDGEVIDEFFGSSVSLSSDGGIVSIGAPGSYGNSSNTGHVRVYKYQVDNWLKVGEDIDGDVTPDVFGISVGISDNGEIIAIGSSVGNDMNFGQVRVYSIASELAILEVVEDILGNTNGINITADQLNSINGVSGAIEGVNYTTALSNGTFVDENNPTAAEIQAIINQVNDALSVNEIDLFNFKLYPNPTKNQFTIQLDTSVELQNVTIYNILGQAVLISEEKTINTSKLSSGSYIVEILTNKGKSSKKLIIE
nr:T9SS type A sorting domain-containing protein [uncultured Psychroserpens sp.]